MLVEWLAASALAQNVLVVIGDDVSVDKIASYTPDYPGYAGQVAMGVQVKQRPTTPTIDGLAAAGVRFTRAWATPLCSPTRAMIHTGEYPFRNGVAWPLSFPEGAGQRLDTSGGDLLGQVLRDEGYATGYFGKWHLGSENAAGATGMPIGVVTSEPHPSLAGWDTFHGHLGGEIPSYTSWRRMDWTGGAGTVATSTTHATPEIVDAAIGWINAQTQPWVAFVTFNAPHTVSGSNIWNYADAKSGCWYGPKTVMGCVAGQNCVDRDRSVYRAQVECMDLEIGDLLDGITDPVLDDTLIVFLGDNGTPHEVQEGVFSTLGAGGKATSHENGVRVPLIVAHGATWRTGAPGYVTTPGLASSAAVSAVDLYDTITEYTLGAGVADGVDATSFLPCLTTSDPTCNGLDNFQYTEAYNNTTHLAAARHTGTDKMRIEYLADDPNTAALNDPCLSETFYDVSADPMELTPQAWVGARADDLRDYVTDLHLGTGSWADGLPYCL
ncbi:MAG: sulfatase-like hydrolase/transferase [Myxococcota bacterium]